MTQLDEMVSGAKRLLVVGGVGLFAAFGLAACGAEEDGGDGSAGTSESTAAEETEAAEDAAGDAAAASYGDGTAPEAPLEPGASAEIGDWSVALGEVVVDAADVIAEVDPTNTAPAEGNIFIMIELQATYNGADAGDPYMDLAWSAWDGSADVGEEPFLLAPEDLSLVGNVASGETASGNVVIEAPEGDYSTVAVGELMGDQFYFAIG